MLCTLPRLPLTWFTTHVLIAQLTDFPRKVWYCVGRRVELVLIHCRNSSTELGQLINLALEF